MSCMEEEILAEVRSLQLYRRWENYLHEYVDVDKEDLLRKMRKAFKEMIFQPPKESWE